jgi:beta-galactosidase beta subunit
MTERAELVEEIFVALDNAAKREAFANWNEAINNYRDNDPNKSNPGRYTIDDIIVFACVQLMNKEDVHT